MHPFYSSRPKMKFVCVLEHLENLRHVKDAKHVSRAWIHYFGVPKLRKWFHAKCIDCTPFDPKMMFGCVLENLGILGHVKRWKTCVRCAEVAKMISHQMHPLYSIEPQMMYGYLLEHLGNLRYVKRCKTCVSGLNALFGVPKLWKWFRTKCIHSTPLDPKWCFVVFWSI
jgi:hypothetical protein